MKKNIFGKTVSAVISAAMISAGITVPSFAEETAAQINAEPQSLTACYDAPAETTHNGWERQASQLGNGFIGAMVHGGVGTNKIQINEHTVWSGGPGASEEYDGGAQGNPEEIKKTLVEVQNDLQSLVSGFSNDDNYKAHFDENEKLVTKNYSQYPGYGEIDSKVKSMFGEKDYFGSYQTLSDLYISNSDGNDSYTNYSRKLDIDNSILTIEYDQNGVHYTGEYFISNPYNMMAVRLSADKKGALSKKIKLDSIQPNKSITGNSKTNTLTMQGRPSDHGENGEKFAQQIKVMADSGEVLTLGDTIYVDNADEITIYMTAGTNYEQPMGGSYNFFSKENPLDEVEKRINYVSTYGYDKLKSAHIKDYKGLYDSESVNFGAVGVPEKTTDKLLAGYGGNGDEPNSKNDDLYLETLYYQFGRYLLISSSRDGFLDTDGTVNHKGELPANLQGIWADQLTNAWNSDYHTNINIQMNYWLAQQTNLAECHKPMINYINSLKPYGEKMKDNYYVQSDGKTPVRGWTVGHECNIWGNAAPGNSSASWFPTAAAWICQDIWEYYQFTKDENFLKENYDTLLKAAQFWVDFLWEDKRDGTLVANPSYSPEHGPFSLGAACDQGIIWEVFNEVLNASDVLGLKNTEDVKEIEESFNRLSNNLQIGLGGQFMEWKDETTMDVTGDNGHRHTNHLFVLHPGNQVTAGRSEADDKYIDAMKVTLNTRGDGGTGWSKAWKLNFWARLRDGNHAHTMLEQLLKESTADNLFDLHPPFQIDGNFGATAGMTEMLLQSQGDSIDLLPALPSAWENGNARGIKARGNIEVDMNWSHGYLTSAVLKPENDGIYKITGKNIALGTVTDSKNNEIAHGKYDGYVSTATGKTENDYLILELKGGETYEINDLDNKEDVSAAKSELSTLIDEAKAERKKHPSDGSFFDAEADNKLNVEIAIAEKALSNNVLFDLLDAKEKLSKAFEEYKSSYDVKLNISQSSGIYTGIQQVCIESTSKIAEIRYTTDGSNPSSESKLYTEEILIPYGKTILKAQPFYNGNAVGDASENEYFIISDNDAAAGANISEITNSVTLNGYPAANAVNGNTSSRWATTSRVDTDLTIELDLKENKTVENLLLDEFVNESEENSRIKSLVLEYYDGENWINADYNTYLKRGSGQHYYRGIGLNNPVAAQRIRMTMRGNSISIWEISIYNTASADKTKLNALINECEQLNPDDYNDCSGFKEALEAAKTVYRNDEASELDIAGAEIKLEKARLAMINSGKAEDKTIAVFSNAQNRFVKAEGKMLRADWNSADGVTADKDGIKAAGPDGKNSQNPYYYFDADVEIKSTDNTVDLSDENNPVWSALRLRMRSNINGTEYRSESAEIKSLKSEYISGTMNKFHLHIPLTAVPNRTGNNADVSIDWNNLKQMLFDAEVSSWAVNDGTYDKLSMEIVNARIVTIGEPEQKWDYSEPEPTENPNIGKNYTIDELNALIGMYVDKNKYTEESFAAYENTLENAINAAENENVPQKNINRAYKALLAAYRGLTEKTQKNWAATFSNMNGTFSVLNASGTQMYADWKQMDQGSLNVSDDISNYRLQLNIVTQYNGEDAAVSDMINQLTIKLRSADKANVPGDTNAGNKEHNYGWDIKGDELGSDAVLQLSIPLDRVCTNKKGIMDWSCVEKIIVTAPLKGDYAKDGAKCTMKLSGVKIVNMSPVFEAKERLNSLIQTHIDEHLGTEEWAAAYKSAKEAALEIVNSEDETISLYDIETAYSQLEKVIKEFVPRYNDDVKITASAVYEGDNIKYTFDAVSDNDVYGTVVVAAYDSSGRLIGIDIKETVAADGKELSGDINLSDVPEYCKVMYLDSIGSMKPISESVLNVFEANAE